MSLRSAVTRLASASPVLARLPLPPSMPTSLHPLQFLSHLQTPVLLPLLNRLNLPLPLPLPLLQVVARSPLGGPTMSSHPYVILLLVIRSSAYTHPFTTVPPRSTHLISIYNWQAQKASDLGTCPGIEELIFVATIHDPTQLDQIATVVKEKTQIVKFFNE